MSNTKKQTDESKTMLYIKHEKQTDMYTISKDISKYSTYLHNMLDIVMNCNDANPIVIKHGEPKHLAFVVSYMKKCLEEKTEKQAPEKPLKSVHLSVILKDEYELFNNLVKIEDFPNNIYVLHDYMKVADYLGCKQLFDKFSSVVAHILMNQSIEKLNAIV